MSAIKGFLKDRAQEKQGQDRYRTALCDVLKTDAGYDFILELLARSTLLTASSNQNDEGRKEMAREIIAEAHFLQPKIAVKLMGDLGTRIFANE